jgi:hypothetical protein
MMFPRHWHTEVEMGDPAAECLMDAAMEGNLIWMKEIGVLVTVELDNPDAVGEEAAIWFTLTEFQQLE